MRPYISASRASVSGVPVARLRGSGDGGALSSGLEEYTSLLAAVRGRRGQTARHGCQPPLLDIRLDEDEARLAEVDVDGARAVGADGGEEVRCLEAVGDVVELLAVAREEDGAGARAVADADDVALNVGRSVGGGSEGLVVAALAGGGVGYGVFVPACDVSVSHFRHGRAVRGTYRVV